MILSDNFSGQAADIVVGFNDRRGAAFGFRRFDDIGINRALREPLHPFEPRRPPLESAREFAPDDAAFFFRIDDAAQRLEKARRAILDHEPGAETFGENRARLRDLARPHQPVVDQNAS